MAQTPERGTPLWMLQRLYVKLMERRQVTDKNWNYYSGDHPLPLLKDRAASDAYKRLLENSQTNVCSLATDSVLQRMKIDGFRVGDTGAADKSIWRVWQNNSMDADSGEILTDTLATRYGYVLVWPNAEDESTPIITAESSHDTIVLRAAGNPRQRVAALKVWRDDWTGMTFANLYTDTFLFKFMASGDNDFDYGSRKWVPREVPGEEWPAPNPLGVVPIVEFVNRRSLRARDGRAEHEDIIPIQDRINKGIGDLVVASESGAFPQKWAVNFEVPKGPDGKPMDSIEADMRRMLLGNKDAKFGNFALTPLEPYIRFVDQSVLHAAAVSQTPPHYFPFAGVVNVGAEALQAIGAAHIAKVHDRMTATGESFEEVIRLALLAAGDGNGATRVPIETIWHDPEIRTLAERADAALKLKSMGLPNEQIWRTLGYSEIEITRMKEQVAQETAINAFNDPNTLL